MILFLGRVGWMLGGVYRTPYIWRLATGLHMKLGTAINYYQAPHNNILIIKLLVNNALGTTNKMHVYVTQQWDITYMYVVLWYGDSNKIHTSSYCNKQWGGACSCNFKHWHTVHLDYAYAKNIKLRIHSTVLMWNTSIGLA